MFLSKQNNIVMISNKVNTPLKYTTFILLKDCIFFLIFILKDIVLSNLLRIIIFVNNTSIVVNYLLFNKTTKSTGVWAHLKIIIFIKNAVRYFLIMELQ
jgi:hypothetical protein